MPSNTKNKMHQTYLLKKNDEVVMETQAVTAERAFDYFMETQPDVYENFSQYSISIKQMPTPNYERLAKGLD